MSSPTTPTLLSLLINDAAIIGSPIISSSPVSEILSPRPVRRVSFDALIRLAATFEPAPTNTTTTAITSSSIIDLLSGSTPDYGWGGHRGRFGVIGGERKGKGFGVIGGERRLKK
ncbi:hypothetical protein DL95DRAFT_406317 [Leptodontidium sp. 2 PMI_412]|nr:hypothetical protein DL95DRAFT_406317 [Leptodontidium sp. 2 PMI_412]